MTILLTIAIVILVLVAVLLSFVFVKFYRVARAFKPHGWTTRKMMHGMAGEIRKQKHG